MALDGMVSDKIEDQTRAVHDKVMDEEDDTKIEPARAVVKGATVSGAVDGTNAMSDGEARGVGRHRVVLIPVRVAEGVEYRLV
ncbi:hypothetical protein DPMN_004512 [Dreissena polymorpha]|uniref:Uncharacterized protein n=1 Tax=Dreissena polymorpha TaxID=45954 RepID=A0A9D4MNN6_DREPO|nr:hypothetical protein DPMN_004512 [Dreissena polymorpha]